MVFGYMQYVAAFFIFLVVTPLFSADYFDTTPLPPDLAGVIPLNDHDTSAEPAQMFKDWMTQWDDSFHTDFLYDSDDALSDVGDDQRGPIMTSAALCAANVHPDISKYFSHPQSTCFFPSQKAEDDDASSVIFVDDDSLCGDSLDSGEQDDEVHKASIDERLTALKSVLGQKWCCFADCLGSPYSVDRVDRFWLDIAQAMHRGADIQEKSGRYRYFGELKHPPRRSDSIALAMFTLLKEGLPSLFSLQFQLYTQGFRQYTPGYIKRLDGALTIGSVHPQKILLKERDTRYVMRELWEKIQREKHTHQIHVTPPQYIAMIEERNQGRKLSTMQRSSIHCLWDLEESGELTILRGLMQNELCSHKNDSLAECHECIMSVHGGSAITQFLQSHKDEEISINSIAKDVSLPLYMHRSPTSLVRHILTLALEGLPIVYDKDAYSVTFLGAKIPAVTPQENTNLLTMLYDIIQQYGEDIMREEVAYYAYRRGHFPADLRKKNRGEFYVKVAWYKAILAIHQYIGVQSYTGLPRRSIELQRSIWEIVVNDQKVRELSYYQRIFPCHQGDLDVILAVQKFRGTQDFTVFLCHVQRCRMEKNSQLARANFMKDALRQNALTRVQLWSLCEKFGMQRMQDLWDTAKTLTQNTSGGRLLYLPKKAMFLWEGDSRYSAGKEDERVAEIYALQDEYPDMNNQEFVYMLAQRGFQDANMRDIRQVLQGLELLGLRDTKDDQYALQRIELEVMIALKHTSMDASAQESAVVLEVRSWLDSKAMENLWQSYLDSKEDKMAFSFLDTEEDTCVKRQKMAAQAMSTEEIIARDIPALKDFLVSKGFCFS